SPMANAMCERSIGTIRRECLDWLIPMSEAHLRAILRDWRTHYNGSRPHMALGPGVPDPPAKAATLPSQQSRHRIRESFLVLARSVLGGLHHEYSVAPAVA
ncbi:MAG: transposase, partial [Hyphomicrobiaceae bacterium]